jgi:type I restriction enzyme S subunit
MKWKVATLDDVAELLSGGTPSKTRQDYWDGDIPWVTAKDLKQNYIFDSELHLTESGAANGTRLVPAHSVLLVVRGMSLANEFRISLAKVPVTFNQDLKALKPKQNIDPAYLFYGLFAQRDHIRQRTGEAAHGTKKLETDVVKGLKIKIPEELSEQRRVAEIAEQYDLAIVNNKRRIQLLEQSARSLFKEWFVHLRYPGHEHDKILDGVPEGWTRRSFTDIADFVNGFAFKPHHWEQVGLPIVKIPELKRGVRQSTPRYSGSDVPDKLKVRFGDLLFSWSGTLAIEFWADEEAYLNQHLFSVKPHGSPGAAFLLLALREALPTFTNLSVGATMKHIRRSALEQTPVTVPPLALREFEEMVDATYSLVLNLRRQNTKIAKARDLLLPQHERQSLI